MGSFTYGTYYVWYMRKAAAATFQQICTNGNDSEKAARLGLESCHVLREAYEKYVSFFQVKSTFKADLPLVTKKYIL